MSSREKDAWARVLEAIGGESSPGDPILSLVPGDCVTGVFRGDPLTLELTPREGARQTVAAVNFYVPAEGAMRVLLLDRRGFEAAFRARQRYGMDAWLFEVRRWDRGWWILPHAALRGETRSWAREERMHDLRELFAPGRMWWGHRVPVEED